MRRIPRLNKGHAVETHLFHETLQPPSDNAVVAALSSVNAVPPASSSVRIGFRNARGQIYRSATVRGTSQLMELSRKLQDIGVEPGPVRPDEMTLGFSSVFSVEAAPAR